MPLAPAPPSLRIGVIGGSNSLLQDGYVAHLREELSSRHGITASFEVHAIGGSSTFTGLAQLCRTSLHRRVDVLLFEYALNDSASFGRRPLLHDHWARAYEGVIRKAVTENPQLLFVSLILGQADGIHRRRICPVSSGIHTLSRRYNTAVIDLNEALVRQRPDLLGHSHMYADDSHYSRPFGVALVAQWAADALHRILEARPAASLPQPVYQNNYSHARLLTVADGLSVPEMARHTCRNTRFSVDVAVLPADTELAFRLSGRVLLVEFVSHPASATLQISVGARRYLQPTTRSAFETGRREFLVSALQPDLHGGYSIGGSGGVRVAFRALREDTPIKKADIGEAGGALRGPVDTNAEPSFWLAGLLYCGEMRADSLSGASPPG